MTIFDDEAASPSEVNKLGPRALVVMVVLAIILIGVAVARGEPVVAQTRFDPLGLPTPSPGDRVRLWADTTMQGRPPSPDDSWRVPVQTHVYENGSLYQELTVWSSLTGTVPIAGLAQGHTYEVCVKGLHTLRVRRNGLLMTGIENYDDFGELPEGDANNDNTINALDASILAAAFWAQEGDASFVAGADFNEDGIIDARDASLMATNYWRTGDLLPDE